MTCETKREKKKTRRGENISEGEMMKKECEMMKDVAFEQIVLSLVTWVGWEMGKTEIVVNRKQY